MKRLLILVFFLVSNYTLSAQNIIVQQQNNMQTQQEKVVIKEVEVPVYIKETPSGPICLNGYLYVFPDDLGQFREYPSSMIKSLNQSQPYGRSNWRLPTLDELRMMEQNRRKLNVSSISSSRSMLDHYIHSYYNNPCVYEGHSPISGDRNYIIRLVSTDW